MKNHILIGLGSTGDKILRKFRKCIFKKYKKNHVKQAQKASIHGIGAKEFVMKEVSNKFNAMIAGARKAGYAMMGTLGFVVPMLFLTSCPDNKQCLCTLKYDEQHPMDKYYIDGFDCNCQWAEIPMQIDTNKLQKVIDVMGTLDLRDRLGTIGYFAADTNYQTTLDIMGRLAIAYAAQFSYITSLDSITEKNPIPRFQVRWNGNCVSPAVPGIVLTFAQYEKWSHLRPGLVICTGLNGEKFQVSEHEIHLFPSEMQGLFEVVYDQAYLEANINQPADIPDALTKINSIKNNPNQHLDVSVKGNFNLNNPSSASDLTGVKGLDSLLNELDRDYPRINYVNGGGQIGRASDSVAMQSAVTLQKAKARGILKPSTIADQNYWFILDASTIWAVPADQVVRAAETNSDILDLSRVIPNKININSPLNVSEFQSLYGVWNRQIKLNPVADGGQPGGKWYVVGTTDEFLANLGEPAAPNPNAMLQALSNLILGQYLPNSGISGSGLDVTDINYNTGNNSGPKLEASHDQVDPSWKIQLKRQISHDLNIATANNAFVNDNGNIIVSLDFLEKVVAMTNIRDGAKLNVSNKDIYVRPDHDFWVVWGGGGGGGEENLYNQIYRLNKTNCNTLTEVPAGKQIYQKGNDGLYYAPPRGRVGVGAVRYTRL